MRRAAAALALLAALASSPRAAAEEDGRGRAFVEVEGPSRPVFAGEAFRVVLRVGRDARWFDSRAVPLFLRRLDIPVRVEAPWLGGVAGAIAIEDPLDAAAPRRVTLAVGDGAAEAVPAADRVRDGRSFKVVEIARTLVAAAPGEIAIAAPTLRFAWSERFEGDGLGERKPLDRREETVTGAPLVVTVVPIPADGQPASFAGAVGRYSIEASASPAEVEAGGSVRLVLRIEGDGNLQLVDRPGPEAIPGFHVLGLLDDRGRSVRTLTYDLAPAGEGTREVPPIPFAYFDPRPPGRWVELRTAAIPVRVRAAASAAPPPAPAPAAGDEGGGGGAAVAIGAAAAIVMGAGAAVWLALRARARERDAADPAADRVAAAAAALRDAARGPGDGLERALAEFLAAGLGVPASAAIGPDLAARLSAAGIPQERAREAAALLDSLVAARYGGGPPPSGAAEAAAALARDLGAPLAAAAAARYRRSPTTRA